MQIQIKAFAKINLALDILGTREDGYHNVNMIMQSVSLADNVSIRLEKHERITLFMNIKHSPPPRLNTAYRIAELFFETVNMKNPGVSIRIQKKIPMGAGLAGGSADAAAVLEGLDRLFRTNLSSECKGKLAAKIGADVPFCLIGGTMLAEGTGASLSPLPNLQEQCYFVLCKPRIHVSTVAAYGKYDKFIQKVGEVEGRPDIQKVKAAIEQGNFRQLAAGLGNIFESVLNIPAVEGIKETLLANGAEGACMSGSGPTVYGIFSERSQAEACSEILRREHKDVFLCTPKKRGLQIFE